MIEFLTDFLMESLTIIAIVSGPFLAVWGNSYLDRRREQRARKMDIFRTLMRTRDTRLSLSHIEALNLIEIEFRDHPKILAAWKNLHNHFGTVHSKSSAEEKDSDLYNQRIVRERRDLLVKMLHLMAKVLKFKMEQMEILEGGYYPVGHADIELDQMAIRRYIVDLSLDKKSIPIKFIKE